MKRLDMIVEDLNYFLNENCINSEDLNISPEGSLEVKNINVGYISSKSSSARPFYLKKGLQELMTKVYNPVKSDNPVIHQFREFCWPN